MKDTWQDPSMNPSSPEMPSTLNPNPSPSEREGSSNPSSLDQSAVRNFAINARKKLQERIALQANKMGFYAMEAAPKFLFQPKIEFEDKHQIKIHGEFYSKKQLSVLEKHMHSKGFEALIDEVAYTWFNRFIALYYMELHDYVDLPILSDLDHLTQTALKAPHYLKNLNPLILQEQNDSLLFQTLLIAQCNELNSKLPFLFEKIADYTELLFPSGMLNKDSVIRDMLALDKSNWQEVEIIGWLYQYYIAKVKERLDWELKNKKGRKVQKEDMPAKTQLFTPKWIVKYMVENSAGKLWLEAHPDRNLQSKFQYYLESAEQETNVKAEIEKSINKSIKPEDIKILDPACGSGHILVTAFEVLFEIYKSQGWQENEIPEMILKNNLYGLDICDRASQLAQLAVMMKAREYDKNISNKVTELNITSIQETNWMDERIKECLMSGVDNNLLAQQQIQLMVDTFRDAKEYGSILDVKDFDFDFWNERLNAIQSLNMGLLYIDVVAELQAKLSALVLQTKIMQQKYECVITNPPYLGSTYFDSKLRELMKNKYPNSKSDTCVAFIEKSLQMTKANCFTSLVVMQSWMFLSSFEQFREQLLNNSTIQSMTHMGNNVVMKIAFGTCATVWKKHGCQNYKATYSWVENSNITENNEPFTFPIKNNGRYNIVAQNHFHSIPGSPIAYWASDRVIKAILSEKLSESIDLVEGVHTRDNEQFLRLWHEISYNKSSLHSYNPSKKWFPYNKGGNYRQYYGNNEYVINWENNGRDVKNFKKSSIGNSSHYFEEGITLTIVTSARNSFRYSPVGFIYDVSGPTIYVKDSEKLKYLLGYLTSNLVFKFLKVYNPTISIQIRDIKNLPFKYNNLHKNKIEELVNQNIQISKDDWDSFETSWGFKTHPLIRFCENPNSHKGLVNGENTYSAEPITMGDKIEDCFNRWKNYKQEQFNKLKANEEELNRLFIEIYGLQDEMTPEVEDKDITVALADEKREIKSLLSYAVGCMFGRYSLDKEGLVFAGGTFDYSKYMNLEVDEDGIIPVLADTWFEDDIIDRLRAFLKAAFGERYLQENLSYIAQVLKPHHQESPLGVIRNYFLKDFYKDHCQMYKKRPIYWMFSSGKAFKCLIYLHRYDKTTLSRIRKDYLHEYQSKLERQNDAHDPRKLALYEQYQRELLEFDHKIKDLADDQIVLDLDDGVKTNYEKFKDLLEKLG